MLTSDFRRSAALVLAVGKRFAAGMKAALLSVLVMSGVQLFAAPQPIPLWPEKAPGEKVELPPEVDVTKSTDGPVAGKAVIRLGNVTQPTITIFPTPPEKDTGAAVLVCPGGGYNILAWDLEGTEVCDWLNSIGVTGVLLKYRVPKREGLEKQAAPLQDAQRALSLVRHRAEEIGIKPQRIGVLGFSAGGHLAAVLCSATGTRTYPETDAADKVSCRPDFAVLVYPAYLTLKDDGDKIAPELRITSETPPTFLVQTQDDSVRVETSLFYYLALKQAKVPAELHVYPRGGHGYGLRRTADPVTAWPERAAEWMRSLGVLERKP